jgi:hypothetical protein
VYIIYYYSVFSKVLALVYEALSEFLVLILSKNTSSLNVVLQYLHSALHIYVSYRHQEGLTDIHNLRDVPIHYLYFVSLLVLGNCWL